MSEKIICDACGKIIEGEPNKVTLKSREGLDGGEWGTYDVCDDCFKFLQNYLWSDTKELVKNMVQDKTGGR